MTESNNNCKCKCKTKSDPSSKNYSEEIKNHAHNKSPFGTEEPSTHTTYK